MSMLCSTPPPIEEPTTPPPVTMPSRKASVRLQERRGSNLSLLLDVSTLGVDTVSSVSTPKEVWLQLLHTSSRPLTKEELQQAAEDTNTLNTEYQKIPTNFVSAAELDVPGHAIKDRYKTILPNPETRVVLQNLEDIPEAGPLRYINANYIRGYRGTLKSYIATQGPMVHTVEDFWDMVWQERSSIIVMLTRLKENNEKCEAYWPQPTKRTSTFMEDAEEQNVDDEEETKKTNQFGRFHIRTKHCREEDGFTVTDLEIQLGSEHRPVRHYWFTSWPDHNIPKCTAPLLLMVEEVETYRKSLLLPDSQPVAESACGPGPVIVHCSAGIGRTGCFIAGSIGVQQLRDTRQLDILEIVCQLRLDRGGMIQTPEQYQFLYSIMAQFSSQLQQEQILLNPGEQLSTQLQDLYLKNTAKRNDTT